MDTIHKAKVENMKSPNGREVPNQFIITTNDGQYFQSYDSVIAFRPKGAVVYGIILDAKNWDYSTTTGKYRNMFLAEDINETRKKIADGTYKLENLNA